MFRIFRDWDGSLLMYEDPFAGTLELSVFCLVFAIISFVFVIFIKDFLVLPFSLLLFVLTISIILYKLPILSILVFALIPALGYLELSLGYLILHSGQYTEMGLVGFMIHIVCLIPLFLTYFAAIFLVPIWLVSFYMGLSDNTKPAIYVSRILWILLGLFMIYILGCRLIDFIKKGKTGENEKNKESSDSYRSIAKVAIFLGLGAVVFYTGILVKDMGIYGPCIIVCLMSVGVGVLSYFKQEKLKLDELDYVVYLFPLIFHATIYFVRNSNKSQYISTPIADKVMEIIESPGQIRFAAAYEPIIKSFQRSISEFLHLIVSLFFKIFDQTIPHFTIPEFPIYLIGIVLILACMAVGYFTVSFIMPKKK